MKSFQGLRNAAYASSLNQAFARTTLRTYQNLARNPVRHQTFPTRLLPRRLPAAKHRTSTRPYTSPPHQKPPNSYNPTPHLASPSPPLSLSARLRKLSREYGWSAFGVYLLLSALDFPFCFAAVRYLGTDRIGRWEHAAVEWVKGMVPEGWLEGLRRWRRSREEAIGEGMVLVEGMKGDGEGLGVVQDEVAGYDHGVKEAEKSNRGENASIWTQLALAYAIHKSFIFIRVPLTVAVTPKVVKVLRSWGWDIGKRRPKGAK